MYFYIESEREGGARRRERAREREREREKGETIVVGEKGVRQKGGENEREWWERWSEKEWRKGVRKQGESERDWESKENIDKGRR